MSTNTDSNIKESKNAVEINSYQDTLKYVADNESVRIFIDHADYIGAELNNAERQLFFAILKRMNRKNVIVLDPELKKKIAEIYNISQATISIALRELIEKEVIISPTLDMIEKLELYNLNYLFIVNPYLVANAGGSTNLKELKEILKEQNKFKTSEFECYNDVDKGLAKHTAVTPNKNKIGAEEATSNIADNDFLNLEKLEKRKMELEIKKLELEIQQLQQERLQQER